MITDAIERVHKSGRGAQPDLHITRCLIDCRLGLVDDATADMNVVRSVHRDGDEISQRLAIHILLAEGKTRDALDRFERIQKKNRIDTLLKRDILKRILDDISLPLHERGDFEHEYNSTLSAKPLFTEFDF